MGLFNKFKNFKKEEKKEEFKEDEKNYELSEEALDKVTGIMDEKEFEYLDKNRFETKEEDNIVKR